MQRLREAFTREHALQCGFCTPGMLIAALDIVKRLPRADENRIRIELAGNLCRCTGYRGIIAAVRSVAETQDGSNVATEPERRAAAASFQVFAPSISAGAAPRSGVVAAAAEAGAAPGKDIPAFPRERGPRYPGLNCGRV